MIEITEKIKALFATFDQSGRAVFRDFLAHNPQVTKWHISADFCLHDEDRPNNVFCFSLIPYDATLVEIKDEIQKSIPKDWKKSKIIPTETIEFLRSEEHTSELQSQPRPRL